MSSAKIFTVFIVLLLKQILQARKVEKPVFCAEGRLISIQILGIISEYRQEILIFGEIV